MTLPQSTRRQESRSISWGEMDLHGTPACSQKLAKMGNLVGPQPSILSPASRDIPKSKLLIKAGADGDTLQQGHTHLAVPYFTMTRY